MDHVNFERITFSKSEPFDDPNLEHLACTFTESGKIRREGEHATISIWAVNRSRRLDVGTWTATVNGATFSIRAVAPGENSNWIDLQCDVIA